MTEKQLALVTGGNRGIGLEICRQLAAREDIQVLLTSRDWDKGQLARQKLADAALAVDCHPLDVTSSESVAALKAYVADTYGRLDILVNNAGILLDGKVKQTSVFEVSLDTIQTTIETNVYGPLLLCQAFIPGMKERNFGRVVNVSSGMGQLSDMGGGYTAYRLSKAGLNVLTRVCDNELKDFNILVNCMCPGWVRTDMGGEQATRPVEVGADTAVWLATLPDSGPRGGFFRDRSPIPW